MFASLQFSAVSSKCTVLLAAGLFGWSCRPHPPLTHLFLPLLSLLTHSCGRPLLLLRPAVSPSCTCTPRLQASPYLLSLHWFWSQNPCSAVSRVTHSQAPAQRPPTSVSTILACLIVDPPETDSAGPSSTERTTSTSVDSLRSTASSLHTVVHNGEIPISLCCVTGRGRPDTVRLFALCVP
jgi:hypothetical protein